jgi:FAD binding domain
MHILPGCLPEFTGIGLPETGNKVNLSMGLPRCQFDKCPSEMKSSDPKVVAEYMRKNFKAFELVDYDDFAEQWVNQKWNRTGQCHCNFYHSTDINVVLMGDACHATSPSIGMGMNTALRDAQVFFQLLQEHNDDFDLVLPNYSRIRVKEGNSLSDLALHLYCFDSKHQLIETIHGLVRMFLHKLLPSFIDEHPQNMIGRIEYNLSEVYDRAVRLGIIGKHRRINDKMRRDYFEREVGMVSADTSNNNWSRTIMTTLSLSMGAFVVALQFRPTAITM